MPPRFRSRLLAFALAAFVFALAATGGPESAAAGVERPQRWEQPTRSPAKGTVRMPALGQRAARIALKAVGTPYRWGGSSLSGGFDCSGLIYWAYGRLGIELPHSSYALYDQGRRVARSGIKAGDVLFFSGLGHVGLYLGRGRMVHAPSSGRRVEVVTLGGSNYGGRLVGARRIVPT